MCYHTQHLLTLDKTLASVEKQRVTERVVADDDDYHHGPHLSSHRSLGGPFELSIQDVSDSQVRVEKSLYCISESLRRAKTKPLHYSQLMAKFQGESDSLGQ